MENITNPIIEKLSKAQPMLWINPNLTAAKDALSRLDITRSDTAEAEARLKRFAPYIMLKFPQTAASGGLIESPLTETPAMLWRLQARIRRADRRHAVCQAGLRSAHIRLHKGARRHI